jgi:hypothetical protein
MDIRLHKYNTAVWVHSIGMTLAMENWDYNFACPFAWVWSLLSHWG